MSALRRPVPTERAVALLAMGLIPALVSVGAPRWAEVALVFDVAVLALVVLDFFLAPGAEALRVRREVEPVLSVGVQHRVRLHLDPVRPLHGELRDAVEAGPRTQGTRRWIALRGPTTLEWTLTPLTRGDLHLQGVWLRLSGPLRLCAAQVVLPLAATLQVYPDLSALSRDALALARGAEWQSRRRRRGPADGREFESLRDYQPGDAPRTLDWKATARRGRPMVRVLQPERNQQVWLLLDCGRHMAGEVAGRRKLDHAVDAALRVARASLDQGDLVGVLAFGAEVQAALAPRRGSHHLLAITRALYRVQASLEETDWDQALALAFRRGHRRSLVLMLTDLVDPDAALSLVTRTRRLVPRHLPLVASLLDPTLEAAALDVPATEEAAFRRLAASRLESDALATVARLRAAGARVVRCAPASLGARTVSAYLDLKTRGAL